MSNDLNFSLPLSLGNDLEFALSQGQSGGMFNATLFNSGLFNQIPISGESESAFLRLRSASGETAESFILSETPLIIQYLDSDGYSGQYTILDDLQHSDILPMDAYSGSSAEITYIQHSTTLSLDAYTGEYADADFTIDLTPLKTVANYSGEYTQLLLENNVRFYADGYSGEYSYINHDVVVIAPNSTFTHFYGSNTYSTTSTCLTLNSLQSSSPSAGINAYFALPQQLVNDRDLIFRFKRTKPASWYDDDFTDAGLWFCFFPNWTPAQLTFASWSWGYGTPNYWAHLGALIIRLRFSNSSAIRINWINNSGSEITNNLTVNSSWTTTEINGTDECSILIRGSSSNTIIQARGLNEVVRQTGTFSNMANPFANGRSETTDTFLIHYHNYTANRSEVLCDMKFGTNEGIILVPFVSLGITQAYSGENSLVDNLITTSILDSTGYSGEVNEFVFTTYPSIDLGIISNYTGEWCQSVLTISAAIDSPIYAGEVSYFGITFSPSENLGALPGYAGERLESILTTYSIFRDVDSREGQTALLVLTTFPPAELIIDGYSGERGVLDLSVELALEVIGYSDENAYFLFDTHPSIDLGLVSHHSGETVAAIQLVTSSVFSFPAYAGENNYYTLTTFPGVELIIPAYSGSRGYAGLATVSLLSGQGYTGQFSDSSLTVFYSTTIVPTFYQGSSAESSLRTIDSLVPIAYSDQFATSSLNTYPATPLEPRAYSGEVASASILPGITFPSIAYDGGYAVFTLDYIVNQGMPAIGYAGNNGILTLATTDALPFIGYTGEYGYLELGAEYAISAIGYAGSIATVTITENLADQLASMGYNGQYVSPFSLSTRTLLPNIGYTGELLTPSLTVSVAAPLLLQAYSGSRGYASMQTAIQIPIGSAYTGQWSNVIGMTNEPHWFLRTGENSIASLSTTHAIPINSYAGERCYFNLDTHPPIPLAVTARTGENAYSSFDVVRAVQFRVLFRTSIMTQVDIKSATYFDLTTDECCGERADTNNLNFMLERGMLPEEVGFGYRTYMEIDLACAPRMKVEFATGQWCSLIDNVDYFEIDFSTQLLSLGLEWDADQRHRLCKGYFIPTGDWIVTELTDILPEDCYADRIYVGETFKCELSDDQVLRPDEIMVGGNLYASMETFPPWELKAYAGERLYWDTFEVGRMYKGERMSFSFYEEKTYAYAGAYAELSIETENYVRFLEEGCLDNEFQYQTKDGDLIPELFNPVPVEGEPYQHDLKAECF